MFVLFEKLERFRSEGALQNCTNQRTPSENPNLKAVPSMSPVPIAVY